MIGMELRIDTLKTARALEGAGFTTSQAEALTYVLAGATGVDRATKDDGRDRPAILPVTSARLGDSFLLWLIGSQIAFALAVAAILHAFRTAN